MHPVSFIRGAIFGAFLMYLFAPRSGADTRRMISQTGDNLKNSLGDIAGRITDEVSPQHETDDEAVPVSSGSAYRPMTYQAQ